MSEYEDILIQIDGGRVLDAATGGGSFAHFLSVTLKSYDEILGVDTNAKLEAGFVQAFQGKANVRFEVGDVNRLAYADGSFDTAAIANSLHHLDGPAGALRELLRVLKPGGYLVVMEMYCDGQSETQMTHVHLHHWWAAVDRANGIVHHETYTRVDLLEMFETLGLADLRIVEISETGDDPKAPEISQQLEPVFERYLQRAEGHPELQQRGEELRRRLEDVGFHSARSIVAIGRKEFSE
jgi:SAM-dependent methyltransferase